MNCLLPIFHVIKFGEFSDGTYAIFVLLKVYKFRYIITVPSKCLILGLPAPCVISEPRPESAYVNHQSSVSSSRWAGCDAGLFMVTLSEVQSKVIVRVCVCVCIETVWGRVIG